MSDYHRERGGHRQGGANADNFEAFESDRGESNPRGGNRGEQSRSRAAEGIPETLYRLRMPHSNETFYGYFNMPASGWPHFRTEAELEAILEGPIAQEAERAETGAEPDIEVSDASPGDAKPDVAVPLAEVETLAEDAAAEDAAAEAAAFAAAASRAAFPAMPVASAAPTATASEPSAAKPSAVEPAAAGAPASTTPAAPAAPLIPARALVVAPTKYGRDVVEVQGLATDTAYLNQDEIVLIERPASIDDLRKLKDNKEKEKQAYVHCRDKIWSRNLPMKLVSAHYLLDEPKILFYFTAESRVDFRELVKDLVSLFKMRIELRQIGVRDEARVTGGCGVCGRVLCCHGVSDRLNPVSIKMAKDQNLSLNSLKISGPCGRLLCCLSYEYQFYKDARRELPQEGAKFMYDGVLFKVVEVNALSSMVKMAGEDGRVLDMNAERFKYSEGRWKVIDEDNVPERPAPNAPSRKPGAE
jgi:cell fate regulator YaaT (PSP1 superfamily)